VLSRPAVVLALLALLAYASSARAAATTQPTAPAIIDALKSLKTAPDQAARQKVYDLVAKEGDARLVPALRAYRDGSLMLRDDRLVRYGDRVAAPGYAPSVLPLLDALTGAPVVGPAGQPIYAEKVDLTGALRAPRGVEKSALNDLLAGLSLNDPDPLKRKEAILAAGDRADLSLLAPLKLQLEAATADGDDLAVDLRETIARIGLAHGDGPARLAAARELTEIRSSRTLASLQRARDTTGYADDAELRAAIDAGIAAGQRYQSQVRMVHHTFAGLSLASILVLLALGLSIIFGLMGVINMAHGEFMMIGAFTTYVVAESFKRYASPGAFDYYPIVAIPAAFTVAAIVGLLCELLVIRHLYGRPLETLLATWGISLVLIQTVRSVFGDILSVTPPGWMIGGWEIAHDLVLPLNRVFIIVFCGICIGVVWLIVNRTKLGLLLRATTQNRDMAGALGVATRKVDALTFAFGAGLAGLAGVVVPLFDKINPQMGQGYIVDSFMVVVVGGVGQLAGVILAGGGLGFVNKYLEPLFGGTGSVIYGKITVLALIILFLQWRPSGLFPPKGRLADA
jgi:urea transport system permease protein